MSAQVMGTAAERPQNLLASCGKIAAVVLDVEHAALVVPKVRDVVRGHDHAELPC